MQQICATNNPGLFVAHGLEIENAVHLDAESKVSSQEQTNLTLPFSVKLTTREQQALRTRSKYFRGGPYWDRGGGGDP